MLVYNYDYEYASEVMHHMILFHVIIGNYWSNICFPLSDLLMQFEKGWGNFGWTNQTDLIDTLKETCKNVFTFFLHFKLIFRTFFISGGSYDWPTKQVNH